MATTLTPYLHFCGNAEEAFNFYKSVFGTDFQTFFRYKDMPPQDPSQKQGEGCGPDLTGADKERVMHACLPVTKNNVLMGGDCPQSMDSQTTVGNNFCIHISTESEEETKDLFNALSDGGKPVMPLDKTFWNAYFGMCVDKFGICWMISYDYNQDK